MSATAFLCLWLRSGARMRAACSPFSCWRRLYMSADTFSSFGCPAVQPAAVAVFARRHLPRRTGGQLCAHRTGEPARRVPACRRECPARAVQPAAHPPARRRHGAPAPRGRTVYTPAERDCGRVRSRPPCGRRPPVEVGIWRVAVSRWIDGRRFLWTRNIKKQGHQSNP